MTTQKAFASYQEIIDLHTESDSVSIIGIHTPVSDTPRRMFGGFFDQFKKFKYLGCSVKLVPAARLPADPLQVSAQFEEPPFQTISPEDMLNPIMFHGCHGNDMGVILNRLYNLNSADRTSDSIDVMEQDFKYNFTDLVTGSLYGFQLEDLYYKALTDNSWKKAHPQRGFRKSGLRPLVYKMATNLQFLGENNLGSGGIPGLPEITTQGNVRNPVSTYGRQFFTPGLTGLGWLDTRNVMTSPVTGTFDASDDLDDSLASYQDTVNALTLEQQEKSEASLPLIYMGIIMLPPAYKIEQYFRLVINHHFAFAGFRGISFSNNIVESPSYFDFNQDEEDDGDTGGDVTPDDPDDPGTGGDDGPISGATAVWVSDGFTASSLYGYKNLLYGEAGSSDPDGQYLTVELKGSYFARLYPTRSVPTDDTVQFVLVVASSNDVGPTAAYYDKTDQVWYNFDVTASTVATACTDTVNSSGNYYFQQVVEASTFDGSMLSNYDNVSAALLDLFGVTGTGFVGGVSVVNS